MKSSLPPTLLTIIPVSAVVGVFYIKLTQGAKCLCGIRIFCKDDIKEYASRFPDVCVFRALKQWSWQL